MLKQYKFKVLKSFEIIRNITQRMIKVEVKLGHSVHGRRAIDALDDDISHVYFAKNKYYYDYEDIDLGIVLSELTSELILNGWIEFLNGHNLK